MASKKAEPAALPFCFSSQVHPALHEIRDHGVQLAHGAFRALASLRAVRLTCRWFCAIAMVPTAPRAAPAAMPSRTLPEEG